MGLQQKLRSLYCGLQAGLYFEELNGEKVVYACDMPYELEPIIGRWIDALPDELLHYDSPKTILRKGGKKGVAVTEEGWEYFVSRMLQTLTDAQLDPGFQDKVRESTKDF